MIRQAFHRYVFAMICAVFVGLPAITVNAQPQDNADRARDFAAKALHIDKSHIRIEDKDGQTAIVLHDEKPVAYLGSTWALAHTAGYSGQPIDVLVLVDLDAVIRGTLLVAQQEPVLTIGVTPDDIERFINGFAGYDLRKPAIRGSKQAGPDAITGATISSTVIRSGILHTARLIAEANGLLNVPGTAHIAMRPAEPRNWQALVDMGAIASRHVGIAEADEAFGIASNGDPAGVFSNIYAAILDPPLIGANFLGETAYSTLIAELPVSGHALWVGAHGLYSIKGTAWRRSGLFERLELTQGSRTIALTREMHSNVQKLQIAGAPDLREQAIFVLPAETGFDPTVPFNLVLLAARKNADGSEKQVRFALDYALPPAFVDAPAAVQNLPPEGPLWMQNWQARIPQVAVIVTMLLALYFVLIFQNQIARRRQLYKVIRLGFLGITVVVLGIMMSAQLSVVHVLSFVQALRSEFNWQTFLLDPVIFITWSWLAVALLFWGRVYCGWLCPFGALQELLNKAARRLGVKQITVPFAVHERLWPTKYILFIGLFAISLSSMPMAFRAAEIEPFKTAVTLKFARDWPYVLYVLALLSAGLFIERFFCRYLCPLGAALAIPARLRMFEWLKRRPQCGKECRICASRCPVQAIHPEGQINPNECIYCINCQTLYFDNHVCPPLKARAARRAAADKIAESARQ